MASAASEAKGKARAEPKQPLTFLDLPLETQREIVGHCPQADLICVALVSTHFRALAASHLYRNFHIVFPDEDDPAFDSPIDGLAGGLDTFVTSDYNYAQHLKELCLDTLSAGERGEKAYKSYLYSTSCGKFMNALLLLTLRKAKCLETFTWNVRVELSRPVYQALHRIPSLNKLHIRMQAGPSLFESPPPLPLAPVVAPATSGSNPHWSDQPMSLPPPPPSQMFAPPGGFVAPPQFTTTVVAPHFSTPPPPLPKAPPKPRLPRRVSTTNDPPTMSGFKNLRTLSVLDIDCLDLITELKACIRSSEGTLTDLKLSFSEALASRSRKPPPDHDPDDSDVDDEFQVVPLPMSNGDSGGPAKAFRAQEEKKTQETILGRIFGVDQFVAKNLPERPKKEDAKEATDEPTNHESPEACFVSSLRLASSKLLAIVKGETDGVTSGQEVLEIIVSAARKYTKSDMVQKPPSDTASPPISPGEEAITAAILAESSVGINVDLGGADDKMIGSADYFATANGSAKPPNANHSSSGVDAKDIDIGDEGDTESLGCSSETSSEDTANTADATSDAGARLSAALFGDNRASSSSASSRKPTPASSLAAQTGPNSLAEATVDAQRSNTIALQSKLLHCQEKMKQLGKEIQNLRHNPDPDNLAIGLREMEQDDVKLQIRIIEQDIRTLQAEAQDAQSQAPLDSEEARSRSISEYIKSTRGLGLKSLAIYLIPVKPSVLSRAVDLHVLEQLTLLNVGNQAAVWLLLAKENAAQPLVLKKIFTDNVSPAFLKCVSQLKEVTELFMVERSIKYKPESFAPRSTVSMDQIRKLILKKHLPRLKYLMIKNDFSTTWDVDEKSMFLICQQGKVLEELAVSMGIRSVHILCQHMSKLANLRALNITHFRNDDTCVWVLRETRKFIVDTLAHYPHLKLEWITIDEDRAVQIVRNEEPPKSDTEKPKGKKDKGKSKATILSSLAADENLPTMPIDWDSDSSADDMEDELKVKMAENRHFYDTWGVKIFEKEIMSGTL